MTAKRPRRPPVRRRGPSIWRTSNSRPVGCAPTLGIIHAPGQPQPRIIALSARPGDLRTLDYGQRWGIEPMFSDFNSRGFGIEDTQIRIADRLDRLILVMALALYWAVSTGFWDAAHHSTPSEKKCSGSTQEGRPQPHV